MKKLFLMLLIVVSCNIPEGFDKSKITYESAGILFDVKIQVNTYNGQEIFKTFSNQIGYFKYSFEMENAQNAYILVTNKDGGNVVGAIYRDGQTLNLQVDPVFVEIIEVIE